MFLSAAQKPKDSLRENASLQDSPCFHLNGFWKTPECLVQITQTFRDRTEFSYADKPHLCLLNQTPRTKSKPWMQHSVNLRSWSKLYGLVHPSTNGRLKLNDFPHTGPVPQDRFISLHHSQSHGHHIFTAFLMNCDFPTHKPLSFFPRGW